MKKTEYDQYDYLFPSIKDSLSFGTSCSLCEQFRGTKIVWGNGKKNAHLMIIGKDSAGADDREKLWKGSRRTVIPLTNKKTGAKVRILLNKAGIDPFSVFITNTVKCNVGCDRFNIPYSQLSESCVRLIEKEIGIVKPKAIVTLNGDVRNLVNHLSKKVEALSINTMRESELIKYSQPYVGRFSSGIRIEIFNLKHPSYVEGKREPHYIKNLTIIRDRVGKPL